MWRRNFMRPLVKDGGLRLQQPLA